MACKCPVAAQAEAFVQHADLRGLDYRLMPALAFVESTGGKFARGNNFMGWANGNKAFPSREAAIAVMADALANGPSYRGKSLRAKMRAFNGANPGYGDRIIQVMRMVQSNVE